MKLLFLFSSPVISRLNHINPLSPLCTSSWTSRTHPSSFILRHTEKGKGGGDQRLTVLSVYILSKMHNWTRTGAVPDLCLSARPLSRKRTSRNQYLYKIPAHFILQTEVKKRWSEQEQLRDLVSCIIGQGCRHCWLTCKWSCEEEVGGGGEVRRAHRARKNA